MKRIFVILFLAYFAVACKSVPKDRSYVECLRIYGTIANEHVFKQPLMIRNKPSFAEVKYLPTFWAIRFSDFQSLQKLVEAGEQVVDSEGKTILMFAIDQRKEDIAIYLIERADHLNVDLDARDKRDYTALHYAVKAGNERVVRILLGLSVDVDVRASVPSHMWGKTALDYARTPKMKQLLRDHGARTAEEIAVIRVLPSSQGSKK